jgi:hypothetical protein
MIASRQWVCPAGCESRSTYSIRRSKGLTPRLQTKAKEHLHEIMYAPDRAGALEEIAEFEQ